MNNAKIIYFFALVIAAGVAGMFLENVLPIALLPDSPENRYLVDLVSIITAVGGFFLLLYTFRFSRIREAVEQGGVDVVAKVCISRIVVWLVLILLNIVLYFEAIGFATNPKYGVIFLAIAFVFCWPAIPNTRANSHKKTDSSESR